jgi:hypothetical protein
MVLGEIIVGVLSTALPVEMDVFLKHTILKPVIAHVECFGTAATDLFMKDAVGSGVVSFKGSTAGGLRMPHFQQGGMNGNSVLSVEEKSSNFSFRSRGGNGAQGFAEDMDSAVGFGVRRVAGSRGMCRQKEMAGRLTASFGKNQVGCIRADRQHHVRGVVADGGNGMSGKIVKKHVAGKASFLVGEAC